MQRKSYTEKVSIVIPVYNTAPFLRRTIESVLSQTYINIEIIIIDDFSNDNSLLIAKEMSSIDNRIIIFEQNENKGVSNSRNEGINIASGNFIAFLDSDDSWYPEKIEKQLLFMNENDCLISCTGYMVLDEKNHPLGKLVPPKNINYINMLKMSTIGCSTVMWNVNVFGKRYFPNCDYEDYALWLSLLKEGCKIYGIQEILSCYTKRKGSLSSNKFRNAKYLWHILSKREGIDPIRSIFYIIRYALLNKNKYYKK